MYKIISQILVFSFIVFSAINIYGQEAPAQDDYLKSSQEKHDFNNEKWSNLKETISSESGGKYSSEKEGEKGSFYQYDEEGYDGNYSEYKNDDEQYTQEGGENGNGEGGGANYHPKQNQTEYGEQGYHPKNERDRNYRRRNRSTSDTDSSGSGSFLYYLLFGVLIALIAFLVFQLFMKSSIDGTGKKVPASFEEIEPTKIPKSELELLLEKAISKSDFRGAIRIYFIFIIKELSEKEWIKWEKEKTNFSYLIEMRGKSQFDSFNDAVSVYELAWYGNYRVNQEDFKVLEPRFKKLLNSLNTESN